MSIELVEENERQAPVERPTVGRRLYYWSDVLNGVVDNLQPFDAGVLYVHPDGKVNLLVTTHEGAQRVCICWICCWLRPCWALGCCPSMSSPYR